ncbi:MAG: hypothetical protein LBV00_08955, partial [Propionibacteriaceae bacterium]|nr:hypothetical protein [Propionibacteriaceae bacterium]
MSTASRAIRRASMPVTRRLILIIVAIAVVVGGGIVAAKVWADSIQEYTNTFLINSVGIGGDNNPGDDECETGPVGSKECTLRAALEEANVTSDKDLIQVDDAWAQSWTPTPTQPIPTINVSAQPSGWMTTTKIDGELEGGTTNGNVSEEDNGAVFTVTNPVTLDLGRKLSARYEVDGPKMALFFVNGPDVTIKGVVDSYTPETTFYVGPKANNVKITDGSVATANFYPDRFLVVRGGATNIEVSYFSISGYYDDSAVGSWGMVLGTDTTHRVNGLTLDHNTYSTSLSSSSVCNETSSAGCNSGALRLNRQGGQWVDNLKFTNNTSNNLNHHVRHTTPRFLNASTAKLNGVTISGNTVNNAAAPTNPVFDLNSATVTGDVTFTDNVVNGLVSAKALLGLTSTSVTGGVTISDNRIKDSARTTSLFNFSASQITGAVTMEKNTIVGSTSTAAVGIVELDTASYGSLTMRDNVFTGLTAASIENLGIVRLPVDRAIGATLIEKNVFQASTAAPGAAPLPAIYWNGPYSSGGNTTKSGLTIQNNVFDGFGQGYDRATIRLYESGISTVQGNTFGARTITQAANVSLLEEGIAPDNRAAAMYQNFNLSSNQKMNTWFPAAVRSKGLGAGATQYQTEDRTEGGTPSVIDAQACAIPLELASPSDLNNGMYIAGARNPGDSVTLDVYWTQANTAEVYLGSIQD